MSKPNLQQNAFASGTVGLQKTEVSLCKFEIEVERLGLTLDQYVDSAELKTWVKENLNTYYVPTVLLTAWHLTTLWDEGTKQSKLDRVQTPPKEVIPATI
jgi:hypothetical protein